MNKIDKIRLVMITLLTALCVLLSAANYELFIDTNKVGNVGYIAENHSAPIVADSALAIELVTESQAHSLQFLLVPPAETGGADVIVSVMVGGTEIFRRTVTQREIFSGEYITVPLDNVIEKGTACTVSVKSTETHEEKATCLVIGSSAGTDVSSWFMTDEQQAGVPSVSFVYNSIKKLSVIIAMLCFGVSVYALMNILFKDKGGFFFQLIAFAKPFAIIGIIVVTVYLAEYLQWNNILSLDIKVIIANILIVATLALFFFSVTGKGLSSSAIAVIVALSFAVANHYLILFRGTTLLPSDLTGISTAVKVADSYVFELEDSVICALFLIVSSIGLIISDKKTDKSVMKLKKIAVRVVSLIASFILMFALACRPELFNAEVYLWKQMTGSRVMNGFLMNFTINVPLLVREKPENYDTSLLKSYTEVETFAVNEKNVSITQKQKPNILFVMNESFADPRTVLNIRDADKLLPNLDRLKNDSSAFVGQTAVSVFGGGTSCSEYEMLTGFSIRTDNANTAPYLTYFHSETPSLVWYMNHIGYNTSSYHAAMSRNWYRNTAYPNIGFERTVFLDESNNTLVDSSGKLTGHELDFDSKYSNFPSDISGYDIVIDMLKESREPVFNFHITMQNHGGYPDSDINYDFSKDEWPTYLKLINRSDTQLGQFLSSLSDFEEPTVVVFFGDHWSYFDETKLNRAGVSLDTMSQEKLTDYYSTPYVVWSNCGYDFSSMPEQTSLSYLSSLVMHQLGFELTPWQNYLVYLSDKIPVYSVYNLISNVDDAVLNEYEYQLKCLHYNALNDKSGCNYEIFGNVG